MNCTPKVRHKTFGVQFIAVGAIKFILSIRIRIRDRGP